MKTDQEHIDYIEDVFLRLADTGICSIRIARAAGNNRFSIYFTSNAQNNENTILHFFNSIEEYYNFNERIKLVLEQLRHDYFIEGFSLSDNLESTDDPLDYNDLMEYWMCIRAKENINDSIPDAPKVALGGIEPNINESLPRQHTLDQLARVQKLCGKNDVGTRLTDGSKPSNPKKLDSYEKFMKRGKKFKPNQNLHPGEGKFNQL